jgi:hypothetical protein
MKKTFIFLIVLVAVVWAQDRPYRVLVAYTQAVSDGWTDPFTVIDNMIARTNLIYDNSQIGQVRAEVVCVHMVNYTETGNYTNDLINFMTHGDNIMDEITMPTSGLRDRYQADICALICANVFGGIGGGAYVYQNAAGAFFLMISDATDSHVFAHEAGHVMGGRHCIAGCPYPNSDGSNYPVTYCHAKHQPSDIGNGWRTVMSVPCNYDAGLWGWVYEVFSNPNLTYRGDTVGTVMYENNSLLMLQRIQGDTAGDPAGHGAVAGYEPTPATLTVNEAIPARAGRLARATTTINITNGFTVNQGARFAATIDPAPYGKRRDIEEQPGSIQKVVPEKTDFKIRLSGNNLSLNYSLTENADITIKICTAAGRLVHAAKLGKKEPGIYRQNLAVPLAAGCYYVSIDAGSYQSPRILVKR